MKNIPYSPVAFKSELSESEGLITWVTWPQFLHLYNGHSASNYITELTEEWKEIIHAWQHHGAWDMQYFVPYPRNSRHEAQGSCSGQTHQLPGKHAQKNHSALGGRDRVRQGAWTWAQLLGTQSGATTVLSLAARPVVSPEEETQAPHIQRTECAGQGQVGMGLCQARLKGAPRKKTPEKCFLLITCTISRFDLATGQLRYGSVTLNPGFLV